MFSEKIRHLVLLANNQIELIAAKFVLSSQVIQIRRGALSLTSLISRAGVGLDFIHLQSKPKSVLDPQIYCFNFCFITVIRIHFSPIAENWYPFIISDDASGDCGIVLERSVRIEFESAAVRFFPANPSTSSLVDLFNRDAIKVAGSASAFEDWGSQISESDILWDIFKQIAVQVVMSGCEKLVPSSSYKVSLPSKVMFQLLFQGDNLDVNLIIPAQLKLHFKLINVISQFHNIFIDIPKGYKNQTCDFQLWRLKFRYRWLRRRDGIGGRRSLRPHIPDRTNRPLTDGRLVIDFLCESLGTNYLIPYLDALDRPNFANGANFAVLGACASRSNFTRIIPIDLYMQILQFKHFQTNFTQPHSKQFYKNALYTFDIGQNDISYSSASLSQDQVIKKIPSFIYDIGNAIRDIYLLGGRKFLVQNTGPSGCLPEELAVRPNLKCKDLDQYGCLKSLNDAAKTFNIELNALCEELRSQMENSTIVYVDVVGPKILSQHVQ
ncbi:hypothetical protein CASFOL_010536 [Castilleja foliolosa]|uniref:GDSL esterase/lipase n=1 Tax=Castilleja foliolosa TaxID=1961234 RepID=A0ABD3DX41_9LAMI